MGGANMRIGLVQSNSVLGDVEANLRRAIAWVREAAGLGCQIVIFPELYLQGYRADEEFRVSAITWDGDASNELRRLADETGTTVVIGAARADRGFPHLVYNSALVALPEAEGGYYDKTHLGNYDRYKEGLYFAPGGTIPVFEAEWGRFGVEICYDMRYPEVARSLALAGIELHVVLSAGGSEFHSTWDSLLSARSYENAFFTAYVNAVGVQRDDTFYGGSRVVGPDGETVKRASQGTEELTCCDIDLAQVRAERRRTLLFRDRRPEVYRLGAGLGGMATAW